MHMTNRAKENYFECHITIEPVFEDELGVVSALAREHGFRPAKLLMQKRKNDTPERSKYDTFLTGRSYDYYDLTSRMVKTIDLIQEIGVIVWRYKVEETMFDSRYNDLYNLLDRTRIPWSELEPRDPVTTQELEDAI
jgi:hypothetical protein